VEKLAKDMTITQVIQVDERLAAVLMAYGMGCLGCAMASGETVEEACEVHGIDVDELMTAMNDFLEQNKENANA